MWNKLDNFEAELNKLYSDKLENRIVRKIEIYASVYNVCADEVSSIDSILSNILIPNIFSMKISSEENFQKNILKILTSIFSDEELILTKERIKIYE